MCVRVCVCLLPHAHGWIDRTLFSLIIWILVYGSAIIPGEEGTESLSPPDELWTVANRRSLKDLTQTRTICTTTLAKAKGLATPQPTEPTPLPPAASTSPVVLPPSPSTRSPTLKLLPTTSSQTLSAQRAGRRPPMLSTKAASKTAVGSPSKSSPKWPGLTQNSSPY